MYTCIELQKIVYKRMENLKRNNDIYVAMDSLTKLVPILDSIESLPGIKKKVRSLRSSIIEKTDTFFSDNGTLNMLDADITVIPRYDSLMPTDKYAVSIFIDTLLKNRNDN